MSDTPQITFSRFVLSLSASVEIHLGDLTPPGRDSRRRPTSRTPRSSSVIAMLKQKTAGNLEESEEQLIDAVLYDLRLRFVEAAGGEKRVVEP